MKIMRNVMVLIAGLLVATSALAQTPAPVEDRNGTVLQGQQRAGIAYRDLQQAIYEAKLAEQEVWQAQENHAAAQKAANVRKQELGVAEKALARAQVRQKSAQQAYDATVNAVDAAHRSAPPGQKP